MGVQAGLGFTIADGVFVKKPGDLTMSILDDVLDDLVDIDDEAISEAIVLLLERAKLVVEGAGAVGVAALLAGKVGGSSGPVAIVLSGGNIDPSLLISVMRHGLTVGGRYLVVRTRVPDRPGEPVKLLTLIAEERVNVMSVEHHREGMDLPVAQTEIELTLLTRDQEHVAVLLVRWPPGATRSSASSRGRKIPRLDRRLVPEAGERSAAPNAGRFFPTNHSARKLTVSPPRSAQSSTPAPSTGRASIPAVASTLAATTAREPLVQIVTTGLPPWRSSAHSRTSRYGMLRLPGM